MFYMKDNFVNNLKKENKLKEENLLKINIEDVNINGEGFCYINNKQTKVCVKNVIPQEEVIVEKTFEKNNFINAKLQTIVKPNNLRVNPKCKYYGVCGGCDYQHLSTKNALAQKLNIIKKYFSDIYNKEIIALESKNDFNYRNKVSFFVKNGKIGLQQENTNNLIEVDSCLILKPILNKVLNVFKIWLDKYKEKNINHVVVRTLNNLLSIVLVVTEKIKNTQELINLLNNEFGENSYGLYFNFNNGKGKILSDKWLFVYGAKTLTDNYNGVEYQIHPYSFMQVNDDIKLLIYEKVLKEIENKVVIEGYSGAGLLSAIISKKAKKVIGVEINKQATQDANNLKQKNNLTNIENINGDCKQVLPQLAKKYPEAIFLIDPPRSGCDLETLKALKQNKISKIIYISCNPYTLKQNIKFLIDEYKLDSLQIFDMFPQTSNIESLAILKRKKV